MPVLHIKALPQKNPNGVTDAMSRAALAIAAAYSCEPEHVWVTWEELKPGHYVEGANSAAAQPAGSHPPICELICFAGKGPAVIEAVLLAASKALTTALDIPSNIFITYREVGAGQVIAGDGVIRR